MHYEGTLKDGTKFDSSYDRGQPLDFNIGVSQVIKCWDEVGINMEIGTKVKVLCPAETAYGSRAVGPIAANSDLIFTIERVQWLFKHIYFTLSYFLIQINSQELTSISKQIKDIFLFTIH